MFKLKSHVMEPHELDMHKLVCGFPYQICSMCLRTTGTISDDWPIFLGLNHQKRYCWWTYAFFLVHIYMSIHSIYIASEISRLYPHLMGEEKAYSILTTLLQNYTKLYLSSNTWPWLKHQEPMNPHNWSFSFTIFCKGIIKLYVYHHD